MGVCAGWYGMVGQENWSVLAKICASQNFPIHSVINFYYHLVLSWLGFRKALMNAHAVRLLLWKSDFHRLIITEICRTLSFWLMIVDSAFHLKDVTSDKCLFMTHILIGSYKLHPNGTRSLIPIAVECWHKLCDFFERWAHRLMTIPEMAEWFVGKDFLMIAS